MLNLFIGTSEPTVHGFVDGFLPPDTFLGWTAVPDFRDQDALRIMVRLDGRVIGSGRPDRVRPDVTNLGEGPHGYSIKTTVPVSYRHILEGRVTVSAGTDFWSRPLSFVGSLLDCLRLAAAFTELSDVAEWPVDRAKNVVARVGHDYGMFANNRTVLLAMFELLQADTPPDLIADLAQKYQNRITKLVEPTKPNNSVTEVLADFESLGENCEFGFVQRHFGCEPISLLRWARTEKSKLLGALENGFEGVGEADNTELLPVQADADEYFTRDKRWGFEAHTFIRPAQVTDYDKEFQRHCKRLQYLTRMMLQNLADGRKILVRSDYHWHSNDDAREVFRALRRFGPNRLLWVRADPSREGAIEILEPGLVVGYIDHYSQWVDIAHHASYDSWLRLCLKVHKVLSQG